MSGWYLLASAPCAPPPIAITRCTVKGCVYPRLEQGICHHHLHFFDYPVSLTGRHISIADLWDREDPHRPNLYIARAGEDCERSIRVVFNGHSKSETNAYADRAWGTSEYSRMSARLDALFETKRRPAPGMPIKSNGLCAARVIRPDGSFVETLKAAPGTPAANSQHTGAFILWKGFGEKKVRRVQRNRPAGWHGNHPSQKPIKVSRTTLDDIPQWTPPVKEKIRIEFANKDEYDAESYEKEVAVASIDCDFGDLFSGEPCDG